MVAKGTCLKNNPRRTRLDGKSYLTLSRASSKTSPHPGCRKSRPCGEQGSRKIASLIKRFIYESLFMVLSEREQVL